MRFREIPLAAWAIGLVGLIVVGVLWTRPISATADGHRYSCPTIIEGPSDYRQLPTRLGPRPGKACQRAYDRRFFVGWFAALAFVGGAWAVILVAGRRRRAADTYQFNPSESVTIVGGVRSGGMYASWPFGLLEADRTRLRVSGRWLGVIVSPVTFLHDDVTRIRVRARPLGAKLTFETASGSAPSMNFYAMSVEDVTPLAHLGWPLERG